MTTFWLWLVETVMFIENTRAILRKDVDRSVLINSCVVPTLSLIISSIKHVFPELSINQKSDRRGLKLNHFPRFLPKYYRSQHPYIKKRSTYWRNIYQFKYSFKLKHYPCIVFISNIGFGFSRNELDEKDITSQRNCL